MPPTPHDRHRGLVYGITAYGMWGLMPLYFWLVIDRATPLEIVACRVGWSFAFLCGLITATRGWQRVFSAVRQRKLMVVLAASAAMIAINWIAYVYAIATNQVLQASFGYFIAPLVNVILGRLFLAERLRGFQAIGVALGDAGLGLLPETGYPHLVELGEVRVHDREELDALEDRIRRILRFLEHAAIELEPGELAVREPLRVGPGIDRDHRLHVGKDLLWLARAELSLSITAHRTLR